MGKRGINMTELGNPLKVLKNLGSGTKNKAWSGNLEHTFFKILSPEYEG